MAESQMEFQMPFGKHKGQDIGTVPVGYLRWLLENMTDLRPATKAAIDGEIARRAAGGAPAVQAAAEPGPFASPLRAVDLEPEAPRGVRPTCAECGHAGSVDDPLVHRGCAEVPF